MSQQDVKAVSRTGSFPVLRQASAVGQTESTPRPEAGRPVPEAAKPDLDKLTARLNLASETIGRDLRFQVDLDSGRSVIQVLDRETGEIIRQIPPEEAEVTLTRSGFVELRLYNGDA